MTRRLTVLDVLCLTISGISCCTSPFQSHKQLCYTVQPKHPTFGQVMDFCDVRDVHLANAKELHELKSVLPESVFMLVSATNRFRTVADTNQELWFDHALGFHHPTSYFHWNIGEPSLGVRDYYLVLNMNFGGWLYATDWYYVQKFICIKNAPEQGNKMTLFQRDNEAYKYTFHSGGFIARMRAIVTANDYFECLINCLETHACKAVYYSTSTKTCIMSRYMDTFLNRNDYSIARDFFRYSIT